MRSEAILLNGVYRSVIEQILTVQRELPEFILFLQPYSSGAIAHLRDQPPSVDGPVRLLISTTEDLASVHYSAEIVGWDDKTDLPEDKWRVLSRIIWTLQPTEDGLYDASEAEDAPSVNLIHVRRMKELPRPFSVNELTKTSDGQPVSPGRTTAGGWVYVRNTFD